MNKGFILNKIRVGDFSEVYQFLKKLSMTELEFFAADSEVDIELLYIIGVIEFENRNYQKAGVLFQKVLKKAPCHSGALNNFGMIMNLLGEKEEALELLNQAIGANPGDLISKVNLIIVLNSAGEHDRAIYEILSFPENPKFKETIFYEYALALTAKLEFKKALDVLELGINNFPDSLILRDLKGSLLLMKGEWIEGFKEYARGVAIPSAEVKFYLNSQIWKGESIEGQTLLVRCDRGIGDTILFMRFVDKLLEKSCSLIFEMPRSLHCLFRHLTIRLVDPSEPIINHDRHINLFELPAIFRTDISSVPPPINLQFKNNQAIPGRIGIAWRGMKLAPNNYLRSVPLHLLSILFELNNFHFICLQKDLSEEEVLFLEKKGVKLPELSSWEQTAHEIALCERVITVDTSIAHLAGSIQVPTWILLRFASEWMWMLDRTDSVWYPSVVLFRQTTIHSWKEPIQMIKNLLKK